VDVVNAGARSRTSLSLTHTHIHTYIHNRYDTVKPNNFSNRNNYIMKLFVPTAVSRVRAQDGCSPEEALKFIVELLQYNDNTSNPYNDDEYVANLIRALSLAYCANKTRLSRIGLEKEEKDISILELRRVLGFYLNIRSSHNHVVEIACLEALGRVQRARLSSWDDLTRLAAPYFFFSFFCTSV
jgi:transcription initiation factor TFIID subunit 2